MSVRFGLLAILDQVPCYGYQLRQEFESRTGGAWPLNVGQVYNTLDRLERDGLVAKGRADTEGHQYWQITPAGSAAWRDWLQHPLVREEATRDDLAIKLALASTLPGVDLAAVIEAQLDATSTTLARRRAEESRIGSDRAFAAALLADWSTAHAEAEVAWLTTVHRNLTDARRAGRAPSIPVRTDPPRRGRPPLG